MNTRSVQGVPLVAVAILAVACGVRDDALNDMDARPETVVIQIENQTTQQATVYMIQDGGVRVRVGEVPPLSERFFEREVRLGRAIEFDIRLLAGATHRSSSVPAIPGDTVHVRIPAHL